jgi:hypothetical protein
MSAAEPLAATVAVWDLNNADRPSAGVALLRALRAEPDFQGRLIGWLAGENDSGMCLPGIADSFHHVPPDEPARLTAALETIRDEEPIDVLLPGSRGTAEQIVRQRAEFLRLGIRLAIPSPEALAAIGELRLAALCHKHGFGYRPVNRHPAVPPAHTGEALRVRMPGGRTWLLHSAAELTELLAFAGGAGFQWQAIPDGAPIQAFLVAGEDHRIRGWACIEIVSQAEDGTVWIGVTHDAEQLRERLADLVRGIRWCGPLLIDLVRCKDGRHVVLRVAPELPNWLPPRNGASGGPGLAGVLLRVALGEAVPGEVTVEPGTLIAHYAQDVPAHAPAHADETAPDETQLPETR